MPHAHSRKCHRVPGSPDRGRNGSRQHGKWCVGGGVVAAACLLGRQSWRRNLLAWAVAIAVPALYFHHYTAPAGHGSILASLRTEPLEVIKFFFAYIGSPFAHLTRVARSISAGPSSPVWCY